MKECEKRLREVEQALRTHGLVMDRIQDRTPPLKTRRKDLVILRRERHMLVVSVIMDGAVLVALCTDEMVQPTHLGLAAVPRKGWCVSRDPAGAILYSTEMHRLDKLLPRQDVVLDRADALKALDHFAKTFSTLPVVRLPA